MARHETPNGSVKYGLRTSLIGFAIGLVVLASLGFALSNLALDHFTRAAKATSNIETSANTWNPVMPAMLPRPAVENEERITELVRVSETVSALRVIDVNGEISFDVTEEESSHRVIMEALALTKLSDERTVLQSQNGIVLAQPVFSNGMLVGYFAIEYPFSALPNTWLRTLMWSLATGALICALCIPLVLLLVHRVTDPLYRLIDFTSGINAGHLSSRVDLKAGNEFDLLGESFNKMMQRMENTMRHIQKLAFVDSVTDLPNRERFLRVLNKSLQDRTDDCFTAVIILNVDRFRWVNETLGPQKGDEALSLIGMRIRKALVAADKAVRLTDAQQQPSMVARLSGDEFAVVVPNIDAKSDITRLMQMVISSMRQPLEIGGQAITLGLTGGVALAPIHGMKGEDLVKNADLALKEARRAGRSKARFYSTKLNKIAMDRLHLEADLRRGIERDEFIPYFQAKVDFKTGQISGAEALVRWQREDGDIISPGIFIPMAEQLGLISRIGESVLKQACVQATRWMKAGHDCKVAVNVSPLQFEEANFSEKVLSSIRDAGLPPGRLELEITETMAVADTDRVSEIMRPLRAMGVRLAIDDFGAGHSNLVTLTKLPFDVFKIDQQFVSALHSDSQAPAVVEMILAMAETMGLETVAEGVETPSQSDFLRRRGCTLAQGYLYAKPIPPDEFMKFLENWRPFGETLAEDFLTSMDGAA